MIEMYYNLVLAKKEHVILKQWGESWCQLHIGQMF